MKVYIITYYNHYESWEAIESVYTSRKKAEEAKKNLYQTDKGGGGYEIKELEISKTPQTVSQY